VKLFAQAQLIARLEESLKESCHRITVLQRKAALFSKGIEYHAFFDAKRLPEYFFNRLPKVAETTIETFEKGASAEKRGKITPEELLKIKLVMEENGGLGEEHVLNTERKRLKRANRPDLAAKVRWGSQKSVAECYDIASFEDTGVERFIEVGDRRRSGERCQREYDEPSSLDGWPGDFRLALAGYGFGGQRTLWLRNMLHDRESRNGLAACLCRTPENRPS
jgi:hypothetical protein